MIEHKAYPSLVLPRINGKLVCAECGQRITLVRGDPLRRVVFRHLARVP